MALTVISALLINPLTSTRAIADEKESPFSVDSSVGFYSSYMTRGQKLYDGASIQPSLTGNYDSGYGTLSANLWMHLTGDSGNQAERFTELDQAIKYSNEIGPVTFSVGNFWYSYSDYGDGSDIADTSEVVGSILLDAPLSPVFTYYRDYRELDADYYEIGLSHEFSGLDSNDTTLVPFVAFGFASNAEKVYEEDGLEHVTTGASLNMSVGDVSVVPNINYTFKVDDTTVNQFWFGMTLGYSM